MTGTDNARIEGEAQRVLGIIVEDAEQIEERAGTRLQITAEAVDRQQRVVTISAPGCLRPSAHAARGPTHH
jgi:hypothetical protein